MGLIKKLVIPIFLLVAILPLFSAKSAVQDEIAERNRQIEELQRQIEQYQQQLDTLGGKSRTLENEIAKLNDKIKKNQLEIQSLNLSITQTDGQINQTQTQIQEAEDSIELHKASLAKLISIIHQSDQQNLTEVFLKNNRLSDFFNNIAHVKNTQENLQHVVEEIKLLKLDLEKREDELGERRNELADLKSIQEAEKRNADAIKRERANILAQTKGQEKAFQDLVAKTKADINKIREQVFYLQQAGITAEDAVKYGQLAALRSGIRPAYLIAVLEVESGLGRNVGRCNRAGDPPSKGWRAIMHTRDHQPFLTITSELGLNPDTTAVSCPQFVNGKRYGWGGAMGPAQFIPSTWMSYKNEVAKLTGHNPANPWNIEDAFVAAAVKLARAGATAKTRAAEVAASKAYYSGNSRCSSAPCNSYANAIQNKAAIIEQNL